MANNDTHTKREHKRATYPVLLYLRKQARLGNTPLPTSVIIEATRGSGGTHLKNMMKAGYLHRANEGKRHPNEEFLWTLTAKYYPKRWDNG